ncbi:MAG: hypothetical protein GY842_21380 [bacterium]|nr:hypothetical protein [bacterium]
MNTDVGQITFLDSASVTKAELETLTFYRAVSARIPTPPDATTLDQMNIVEVSGALDFWNDPQEDVYDETDGDAV